MIKLYSSYTFSFFTALFLNLITVTAQNSWVQKSNLPGTNRAWANAFSIGSKGYIIGGANASSAFNDLWEYDPSTDGWTQKASCSGTARARGICFTLNDKVYYGNGNATPNSASSNFYPDFWEWDPSTNAWTQKANSGSNREASISFSINGKGYMGTGWTGGAIIAANYLNDFWEYDPTGNTWTQKANFSGGGRWATTSASIGAKGYVATGYVASGVFYNDLWEFDPVSNSWTQKTSLPATTRNCCAGFAFAGKFYIGTGNYGGTYYNDFYEYDPVGNSWTQRANFPGNARNGAIGFSIGTKGYLGTGNNGSTYYNDLWEYTPINVSNGDLSEPISFQYFPNPTTGKLTIELKKNHISATDIKIFSVSGTCVYQNKLIDSTTSLDLSDLESGIYFIRLTNEEGTADRQMIVQH